MIRRGIFIGIVLRGRMICLYSPFQPITKRQVKVVANDDDIGIGTYKIRFGGGECYDSDYEWTTCDGHMAGYLVPGV